MEKIVIQAENPDKILDHIFELEKLVDQMRTFIHQKEQESVNSINLKDKIALFKAEIKKNNIEIIKLRLKYESIKK